MSDKNNNVPYILVNVPSFILNPSPSVGIPQLLGILKEHGINSEFMDLNLKYVDYLLTGKGIRELIHIYQSLYTSNHQSDEEVNKKDLYPQLIESLQNVSDEVGFYKEIMRDEKSFYNILLSSYSKKRLEFLINVASIQYEFAQNYIAPNIEDYRTFCENEKFDVDISKLMQFFNFDFNQLKTFYQEKINEILSKNPKIVGISIDTQSQLISGLYFCYLLKKQSNVYINVGGFFFSHFYKIIKNLNDLFSKFFDSISIDNNTCTIYELVQYINNEINIEAVGNIIYCENGEIKVNHSERKIKFNELPFQEFNGFKKENYHTPEFVIPIQTSKSCYWRRCIFCSSHDKEYEAKSLNNVIAEIEYLSQKYDTKYFCFWDNSIHPKFLDRLADELISKNLQIKYSIFARFEKDFNFELLNKLQKSGCCNINWGLDSADKDILNVISKGIELDNVKRILKESHKNGIFNTVYLILGHPKETISHIKNDVSFIKRYKKYIDMLVLSPSVWFVEGSVINKKREYYKSQILTTREERQKYYDKLMRIKDYDKKSILSLSSNIILYVAKKGLKSCRRDLILFRFFMKFGFLYKIYLSFRLFIYSLQHRI